MAKGAKQIRTWYDRVRDLQHRLECEVEQDRIRLARLYNEKERNSRRKVGYIKCGELDMKITLSETVLGEKEDMARALKEYADMHDELEGRFNEKWTMREGARWFKK